MGISEVHTMVKKFVQEGARFTKILQTGICRTLFERLLHGGVGIQLAPCRVLSLCSML